MDCVVVAGGRPAADDPLYPYTQGRPKALLTLNGRAMLEYVVNGLQASGRLEDIVVVGLGPDAATELSFSRPVTFIPDQGSLYANARTGMELCLARRPEQRLVLFASADIPLLRGDLVDEFIAQCYPHDCLCYYPLARQETIEQQFPGAGRTYARLKGEPVAGGDIALVHTRLLDLDESWGDAVTNARKTAWKMVRLLGFRFLLKYLLRQLTVADIENTAQRIIGGPVKIVFLNHAECAMDADKPHQVELLRRRLEGQPA